MATATNNRGAVATVRIAPVERWCEDTRPVQQIEGHPEVGMSIQIEANSMDPLMECDGKPAKHWKITSESHVALCAKVGRKPQRWENGNVWICEHMLEMD